MENISIKIVTPERTVFEGAADSVSLPTQDGQITLLPKHVSYISILVPGEVVIRSGQEETLMAVSGGFIEFNKNELVVLADTAERAEEIDVERAEQARKRAEELKKQVVSSEEKDYAQVAGMIEKEMARVRVGRKRFTKKGIHFK